MATAPETSNPTQPTHLVHLTQVLIKELFSAPSKRKP
jgi:hypothetical protein